MDLIRIFLFMNRVLVCYKHIPTDQIFVDTKKDFKEICMYHGEENYLKLDEKLCYSKKDEINYTNSIKTKFTK